MQYSKSKKQSERLRMKKKWARKFTRFWVKFNLCRTPFDAEKLRYCFNEKSMARLPESLFPLANGVREAKVRERERGHHNKLPWSIARNAARFNRLVNSFLCECKRIFFVESLINILLNNRGKVLHEGQTRIWRKNLNSSSKLCSKWTYILMHLCMLSGLSHKYIEESKIVH